MHNRTRGNINVIWGIMCTTLLGATLRGLGYYVHNLTMRHFKGHKGT